MLRYDIRTGVKKIKTKTFMAISGVTLGTAGLAMAVAMPLAAKAAGSTVVVTPSNMHGWTFVQPGADTRPGGTVSIVSDGTMPAGLGSAALEMTTDSTDAAKAQAMNYNFAGTPLSQVDNLSYWTKQETTHTGFVAGLPSYQLGIDTDGTVGDGQGFTTLVYEPYNNFGNSAVQNNVWQNWNVSSGTFWSSRTIGTCLTAGAGGPPFYNLSDVETCFPNAVVVGFGVNVGTTNSNYAVETDGIQFNDTTYNFEVANPPTNKDACKNGGWQNVTDNNGGAFTNQGLCVSYANHHDGNGADDTHAH